MGKLRFDCYEDFAKRIEYPVIVFRADSGEIVIMNYEAKLILGQKTEKVILELEDQNANHAFWTQLHDRKAMTNYQMILSNEVRQFPVAGIVNEFEVDEDVYYMFIFDQRSVGGTNHGMIERTIENSNIIIANIGFRDDRELKVHYISKNINRFGFTCEQFYNGKLQFKDIVHPDDLDIVLSAFDEKAKTQVDSDMLEYRIVTESRKVCYVRCNVHFTRNTYGSIEGMDMIMVDVTEQEMEKNENQYLRDAIEQSKSVVLVGRFTAGKGIVKYVSSNASRLGMDVDDLRKGRKLFTQYVISEDRQRVSDILRNADRENVSNYTDECRILGEDGNMRWVRFCMTIKNIDDITHDAELLMLDVTEEKLYEQKLLQSQKELEEKLNYVTSSQIANVEWEFDDFLAKEDIDLFLQTYSEANQIYTAGIRLDGTLLTKPSGPMMRLGEFYDMLERPIYRERVKKAIEQLDENHKYMILELEEGDCERQLGVVPIIVEGRMLAAALICGLDAEMVTRMHMSICALQRLTDMLVSSQYKNRYLELDSRKSRMAEEELRKELEGQLILAKAFANMRYDVDATMQEIIEKACELLHVSSIAVYYGDPTQESYNCIAKHFMEGQKHWEYPDQSWRVAEICRNHPEVAKGGYIVYGTGGYEPEMEVIMSNIKAHSLMIHGIRVHHVVCGGLIVAAADKREFREHEIVFCADVARTIQGILYRKLNQADANMINKDLLNSYNYMKECIFIKDVQTGKVLFANEQMENLFGMDVTGTDSRSFLQDPTPTYTRDGVQQVGDIKWQSYIQRINKIMNIQELAIDWQGGKNVKIVIMRENANTPDDYNRWESV